jgi:mannose-6-phosphate isomerase-like protein (cupin superfamily)
MAAGEPKAVRPEEGRALRVLGNTFIFKVVAADTNDTYSIFEIASPPKSGIPPHINTREAETHIVLQRTYSFLLGTQTYEVEPGAIFFVPRGTLHGFQNVGAEPGRLLLIPSPGSNNEAFVIKLAERFGPELPPSRPDPAILEALATLAHEYGVEPSIAPG